MGRAHSVRVGRLPCCGADPWVMLLPSPQVGAALLRRCLPAVPMAQLLALVAELNKVRMRAGRAWRVTGAEQSRTSKLLQCAPALLHDLHRPQLYTQPPYPIPRHVDSLFGHARIVD